MTCRNCRRELPLGSTVQCPFCGTRQDTYITPRSQMTGRRTEKRKTRRASLMSTLSVFFVIAVVCILIPFLREQNRKTDAAEIEQKYTTLLESENKGEKSWEDEVSFWVAAVDRYKRSYPGDLEGIAGHESMMNTLLDRDMKKNLIEEIEAKIKSLEESEDRTTGVYAAGLSVLQVSVSRFVAMYPEDTENKLRFTEKLAELGEGASDIPSTDAENEAARLEAIEYLLETAKESIIDFETFHVEIDEHGFVKVSFRWKNLATVGVENVTVTLRAVDNQGETVTGAGGKALRVALRTTAYCAAGGVKSSVFTKVWNDSRIHTGVIDELRILYADSSELYLPPEVCNVLW